MSKTGPVTIGDLRRERKLIEIGCSACGHYGYFIPGDLGLPDDEPVPAVYQRARCSRCGTKGRGYSRPDARQPGGMAQLR